MQFHLLHPRDQLVRVMDRVYLNRMTTLSGGNLSIKDTNGDIWITPAGVDKGSLTRDDIMCVGADGRVHGPHAPSSELPFHRAIYNKRPDIHAIVHAHPSALVTFSIIRKIPDTNIIPQANRVCGRVGYASYALPGSEQLGKNIADTFGEGYSVVLLENHGTATGGPDLLNAFQRLETLEFCARTIIQAKRIGEIVTLTEEQISGIDRRNHDYPDFVPLVHSTKERELRRQLVDIVHRACDRFLMISTEGVASARVSEDSFLITPTGMDRGSLELQDIVLIQDGKKEEGKHPSRSARLHEAIYKRHPWVNSILTAQSPNATAFAVTQLPFETRTIPECYILLRDIPTIPFGMQYLAPEKIAGMISTRTTVLLIQNDCLMTVGSTVLEAFDKLEVAEFSAGSLIDSGAIGTCVPIGPQEVRDLKDKFFAE